MRKQQPHIVVPCWQMGPITITKPAVGNNNVSVWCRYFMLTEEAVRGDGFSLIVVGWVVDGFACGRGQGTVKCTQRAAVGTM